MQRLLSGPDLRSSIVYTVKMAIDNRKYHTDAAIERYQPKIARANALGKTIPMGIINSIPMKFSENFSVNKCRTFDFHPLQNW